MELQNKLGLAGAAFEAEEERVSKRQAKALFESGALDEIARCSCGAWTPAIDTRATISTGQKNYESRLSPCMTSSSSAAARRA